MSNQMPEFAQIIMQQLGGSRSINLMLGLKHVVYNEDTSKGLDRFVEIHWKVKGKDGINVLRISLLPSDTYKMQFMRVWGTKVAMKTCYDSVYCDQLIELFRDATGLSLTIPRFA